MVKTSFKTKPAPIGAQIGAGLGKGLAEQLPKEIAQSRLQQGLKQFEKNSQGLTPLQQATQLFSIPGVTPQMVQILPQLLQQQQLAQSLGQEAQNQNQPTPFPEISQNAPNIGLTTRPGIEATRKGYIPPTLQERDLRAKQVYQANPSRFANNPQNAIDYVDQEISREGQINQAYQQQRAGEQNIQRNVQQNLASQAGLLKAKVPGTVYSDIEQRAIRSVLPPQEGGEGLTDEEAKIKYGKELDDVSRDYQNLNDVGNWSLLSQKPFEGIRSLKSIRQRFKERNDLENLADSYIGVNGLSPGKAYYLTYPPSEIPELNNLLKKLPDVKPKQTPTGPVDSGYNADAILNHVSEKLAKDMGKTGSPLAIAEYLDSKGYDGKNFLDYVNSNRKKLDLTERQVRELQKPRSFLPTLPDMWLFTLTGQENFVE